MAEGHHALAERVRLGAIIDTQSARIRELEDEVAKLKAELCDLGHCQDGRDDCHNYHCDGPYDSTTSTGEPATRRRT